MNPKKQSIELLAPAGNFEKLEIAIHYGADAVYLAGENFSLRNFSGNFTLGELKRAVQYAHKRNVKIYLACNIYSRNNEQKEIADYLEQIGQIKPDAIIIADPGIIMMAGEIIPHVDIHLSTQSNTTNYNTVRFWEKAGIKRINTARELSISEITELAENSTIEIEAFIHGAMCISYSGRCLLSSFLLNRDGNRGLCAHPCRWKYSIVEEQRPGEYMPIFEDNRGTYIFHSKDLCTIEHIPQLMASGITSFKIEGRMKGINYLASTVKVYREAIDAYLQDSNAYTTHPEWLRELSRISHRNYCTGFYFDAPTETVPNYSDPLPANIHNFVGKITDIRNDGRLVVAVRNKIRKTDRIEILTQRGPSSQDIITQMTDMDETPCQEANPNSEILIRTGTKCLVNDLLRKA